MAHHLAAGVIVLEDNAVLLVKDKYGWSLPKGSLERGETFLKGAEREAFEEAGIEVIAKEAAFVTEYTSEKYGQYLQVYYEGSARAGQIECSADPDDDINQARYVRLADLRSFITFRPWIIPLEHWVQHREMKYYSFDLDVEGFHIPE